MIAEQKGKKSFYYTLFFERHRRWNVAQSLVPLDFFASLFLSPKGNSKGERNCRDGRKGFQRHAESSTTKRLAMYLTFLHDESILLFFFLALLLQYFLRSRWPCALPGKKSSYHSLGKIFNLIMTFNVTASHLSFFFIFMYTDGQNHYLFIVCSATQVFSYFRSFSSK